MKQGKDAQTRLWVRDRDSLDAHVEQLERLYVDVLADSSVADPSEEMKALSVFLEDFLISRNFSRPWTALYSRVTGDAVDVLEQALKAHTGAMQATLLARIDDLERRLGSGSTRPASKQVQPIDLSKALRHGDASAEYGSELSVTTARAQWHYAVTLSCPSVAGPAAIEVDAEVEKGSIGFGLNGPDLKAYVGDEMVLEVHDGRQLVRIPIPADAPQRLVLVIRNVSGTGRSRGTVFSAVAVTEG